MRALGAPPPRPVMDTAPTPTPLPAAPAGSRPVMYAGVTRRGRDGVVLELALPGPTAGAWIPLMGRTADGGALRVGWIGARGQVKSEPDIGAYFDPGTRLVAATDPRGRVVVVTAVPKK
jgi:hypothetical protein